MSPDKKIGRNDPCPCGSHKKYKKCCGANSSLPMHPVLMVRQIPFKDIPPEAQATIEVQKIKEAERIKQFGHVRPLISTNYQGNKAVAVGSKLHLSPKWKTFHDFLFDYIWTVFGNDWGNAELKKPYEEQHPLLHWYKSIRELKAKTVKEPGKVFPTTATGPVMAYIALAYDLYTMDHHLKLKNHLIERLKIKKQFQGARYETYVSAAVIRGGFDLNLEDETDPSTSHCEFNAIHKILKTPYSVEAKSRHREGYLGQDGAQKPLEEINAEIWDLLKKALRKRADNERIIFIDINVPPLRGNLFESEAMKQVSFQMRKLESVLKPCPPAFIFFTNHPYHYVGDTAPEPGKTVIFTTLNNAEFKKNDPSILSRYPALKELVYSVINHIKVPTDLDF